MRRPVTPGAMAARGAQRAGRSGGARAASRAAARCGARAAAGALLRGGALASSSSSRRFTLALLPRRLLLALQRDLPAAAAPAWPPGLARSSRTRAVSVPPAGAGAGTRAVSIWWLSLRERAEADAASSPQPWTVASACAPAAGPVRAPDRQRELQQLQVLRVVVKHVVLHR